MTFVCIQAGHYHRTSGATGAPGEQKFNWDITLKLSEILQTKGFMIQIVGADPKPEELKSDFDLFISLHCDANNYGTGGGVIGAPEPSTDSATKESYRIKEAIESVYFKESGIVNHPERLNKNITYYYMWKQLSAKTPCVLLEMGVAQDAHDSVILNDTNMVAVAIAKGICKAFNIDYEPVITDPITPPQPTDPCANIKVELEEAKKALYEAQRDNSLALAAKDVECQEKLLSYKTRLAVELDKSIKKIIEDFI